MNIYVGNLSYRASEQDLETLFGSYGTVLSAKIVKDRFNGRSKGFGFVEMDDNSQGDQAIQALHETEFMERKLIVNEARPRE